MTILLTVIATLCVCEILIRNFGFWVFQKTAKSIDKENGTETFVYRSDHPIGILHGETVGVFRMSLFAPRFYFGEFKFSDTDYFYATSLFTKRLKRFRRRKSCLIVYPNPNSLNTTPTDQ